MAATAKPRVRDLLDVDAPSPANGQALVWDTSTSPPRWRPGSGGGGGGAPSGPAGGVLSGTYPDPGFAVDMATQAELDAGLAGKQDAATAATDSELAAAVATLNAAVAAKQDAATAATDAELSAGLAGKADQGALDAHTADTALDGGPHGLPALTGDGMAWVRVGGALVAVDVATQAELDALAGSVATDAELAAHVASQGNGAHVPSAGIAAGQVAGSLKPSGTAAAGDEALRALGHGATQALPGDEPLLPTTGQKNALAGSAGTPGTGNEFLTRQDDVKKVYEHVKSTDFGPFVTPGYGLVDSGSFTPDGTEAVLDVDVTGLYLEGASSQAVAALFYGPAGSQPFTPTVQGASLPAGVTQVDLGAFSSTVDSLHRRLKLTGLTPGTAVAWEVAVAVVGGARQVNGLPESPGVIACSDPADFVNPTEPQVYGDFMVCLRGQTRAMIVRSNHYQNPPRNELAGSVTLTGSVSAQQPAITPDGTKAIVPIFETNQVAVIDTATLAATYYTLPGGTTGPNSAVVTPSGGTAWVICFSSSEVIPMTIATGVFGTPIALGGQPTYVAITPDGTKLLVTRASAIRCINIPAGTTAWTTGTIGTGTVRNPAITPDGTKAYVFAGTTPTAKCFVVTVATGAVDAGTTVDTEIAPTYAVVMPDGLTLMAVGSNADPANQIYQFGLPSLTRYVKWGNALSPGTTTRRGITSLAVNRHGSIYVPGNNPAGVLTSLNVWYGGSLRVRPSASASTGEGLRVVARGAH